MSFKKKCILQAFIVLYLTPQCYGQMILNVKLPYQDSGTIEIFQVLFEDSVKFITKKAFATSEIKVHIKLNRKLLLNNPVLKYVLYGQMKTYESTFAGENGKLMIDLETKSLTYEAKSKFFKLTQKLNHFKGDSLERNLILEDISRLYMQYPISEYVQYIVFNSVKNNLMSETELYSKFKLNTNNSYWIGQLKELLLLKNKLLEDYFYLLEKYSKIHEFVLVKFWATWCRPCLEDDKIIYTLKNSGDFKPYILAIQNESMKDLNISKFENILDPFKIISNYYGISDLPTYILFTGGEKVFQTNSLEEILAIIKL